MSTINDGGPAFPVEVDGTQPNGRQTGNTLWQSYGMSLRDYMAIHATEADILHQTDVIRSAQICGGGVGVLPDGWIVTARYMHADAMLKARQKGGGTQ
jgi:hypothetical protein